MILAKIRGFIALIQFALSVFIVIILMYLFNKHNHKIRRLWASMQIKLLGISFEIQGELDENARLLLINHQSLLDIVIMEYIHSRNIAWVAKKEIAALPIFGHILKAPKMIEIDRENKVGLVKLLKDVKDRLDHGRPIAIFPEGTRTDGKRLLKFKAGAKMIAQKNSLRVQPIVLINTRDILDSKKLTANPGMVKVIYLESFIPPQDSSWYEDLEAKMRAIVVSNNVAG